MTVYNLTIVDPGGGASPYLGKVGAWSATGGTAPAVLNDGSNSTYISCGSAGSGAYVALKASTFTVPATEQIISVVPWVKYQHTTAAATGAIVSSVNSDNIGSYYGSFVLNTSTSVATVYGANVGFWWGDGPWTTATIAKLGLKINSLDLSASRFRVIEAGFIVTTSSIPVVSIVGPAGAITDTSKPTVTWTYTDTDGGAQSDFEVKVFTSAQSDPTNATALYGSGVGGYGSAAQSWQVPENLLNLSTYYTYVRIWKPGGAVSAWATQTFSLNLTPPCLMSILPLYDPLTGREEVFVQSAVNLLTEQDASLENSANVGTWIVGGNCTVTNVAPGGGAAVGSRALAMTSAAAGDMWANSGQVAVSPGVNYTIRASMKSAVSARSIRLNISWRTSGGAWISSVSSDTITSSTSAWQVLAVSGTAPTNAAYLRVEPYVVGTAAASEVHWTDKVAAYQSSMFGPQADMYTDWSGSIAYRPNFASVNVGLETDTHNWSGYSNTTFTRDTAIFRTGSASAKCVSVAAGAFGCNYGSAGNRVPVVGSSSIIFSTWAYTTTASRTVTCYITWYNSAGGSISQVNLGASSTLSTSTWINLAWTATAPATAVTALVTFVITATGASETFYFDNIKAESTATNGGLLSSTTPTVYIPPGVRKNYCTNPNFEGNNTTNWTGANSATLAASTVQKRLGSYSMLVTCGATAAQQGAYQSLGAALAANTTYTMSAWFYNPSSGGYSGGIVLSAQGAGLTGTVNSTSNTTKNSWTRATVTFTTGATPSSGVSLYVITSGNPTAGNTFYVDAVTIEKGPDFYGSFDGAYNYLSNSQGLVDWLGAVHVSQSYQGAPWMPGGYTGAQLELDVSYDESTWEEVPRVYDLGTASVALTPYTIPASGTNRLSHYEVKRDRASGANNVMKYRARVTATSASGSAVASAWAIVVVADTTNDGSNRFLPVLSPLSAVVMDVLQGISEDIVEEVGVFYPLGGGKAIAISDGVRGTEGSFQFVTQTTDEWDDLSPVLNWPGVLLWQGPGQIHKYIRITGRSVERSIFGTRDVRTIECDYVEVEA